VAASSGGKATSGELSGGSILSPGATSFLNGQSGYTASKPKAFVNWILFDEQFKYVSSSSGFEQVGSSGSFTTHSRADMPVTKNGYLYIYVSNETPNIDVFFDNLQVTHIRGPLIEEAHYYPFGLEMKAISTRAFNFGRKTEFRANAGSEFEEDLDLNMFSLFYRQYDPQIGRFTGIDIRSEETYRFSCYQFAANNPIYFVDPLGDKNDLPVSAGNGWYRMPDGRMVGWGEVEWYLKDRNLLTRVWSAEDMGGGTGSVLSWGYGNSRSGEEGFRLVVSWTFGQTSGQVNQGLGISNIFLSSSSLKDIGASPLGPLVPLPSSGGKGASGSGYQFPYTTFGSAFYFAAEYAMYNEFGWTSLPQSWKYNTWRFYGLHVPGNGATGGKLSHGKAISTKLMWAGRAIGLYNAGTIQEMYVNGQIGTTRMLIEQGSNAFSTLGGPIGAFWGIGWEGGRAITSIPWYRRNVRTGIRDLFGLERDEFVEDDKIDRFLNGMGN
jgi:RHS repeat-associated protein